jgi:hypothetical protein
MEQWGPKLSNFKLVPGDKICSSPAARFTGKGFRSDIATGGQPATKSSTYPFAAVLVESGSLSPTGNGLVTPIVPALAGGRGELEFEAGSIRSCREASAGAGSSSMSQDSYHGIPTRLLHPKWRDMSEWVVHFTNTQQALQSILSERFVRPSGPYGNGRNVVELSEGHLSACLSEIPLDHLQRLYQRRGKWGMGFHKRVIDAAGGGRVWYLEKGTNIEQTVFDLHGGLLRAQDFDHPFWSLTPFIDFMSDDFSYRFDWEREWRVPGGLRFELSDVAFLLAPDDSDAICVVDLIGRTVPTFSASGPAGLATAPEELGDEGDHLVATFADHFLQPIELLLHDGEDPDAYAWPVPQWSTDDAVDYLFSDPDSDIRSRLVGDLDEISPIWVKSSDWHEMSDEGSETPQ